MSESFLKPQVGLLEERHQVPQSHSGKQSFSNHMYFGITGLRHQGKVSCSTQLKSFCPFCTEKYILVIDFLKLVFKKILLV